MTTPGTPPLVYLDGCDCGGVTCAGHVRLDPDQPAPPDVLAAQHTYTAACDGLHPPGECPAFAVPFRFGGDQP